MRPIVNAEKTDAVFYHFQILGEASAPVHRLRLRGLDPRRDYEWIDTGERFGGDVLMYAGLIIPETMGGFRGAMWRFRAV